MEKIAASSEMRRRFGKTLQEVVGQGDCIVIARYGRPVAALVPLELYRQLRDSEKRAHERTP